MRTALLAVALAFSACSPCEVESPDAAPSDALQAEDACPCIEPYRCEWPEAGITVGANDCLYCKQGDGGEYICMNLPLGPP